ncbi:selenocysteine-specific translation elongation factor, partial [Pelomonas sp. HMWF004]
MIIGTAGHIDHGKTTLVRALTGVDTDRLPEEKARGISIELGYAYLDLPAEAAGTPPQRLGFIDVPGHEKLVHTMLAGASGIDYALLLVAADDGVMPQTREHLAVLSLLGLTHGAVVITKTDRAAPTRVSALTDELRALLAGTGLDAAPILPVSAQTGQGVDALRQLLFAAARQLPPRHTHGLAPRLAVDRAFT